MTTISRPRRTAVDASRGARRVGGLVVGVLLLVGALALAWGGAALSELDSNRRDGYVSSDGRPASTAGYALATDAIHVDGFPDDVTFGEARLVVTPDDPEDALFVGVASPEDAAAFLQGVEHGFVTEVVDVPAPVYDHVEGGPPTVDPASSDIWVDQSSGTGPQSVSFAHDRRLAVVVMNSDLKAGLDVSAEFQAEVPYLRPFTWTAWSAGGLCLVLGLVLLRRSHRRRFGPAGQNE